MAGTSEYDQLRQQGDRAHALVKTGERILHAPEGSSKTAAIARWEARVDKYVKKFLGL